MMMRAVSAYGCAGNGEHGVMQQRLMTPAVAKAAIVSGATLADLATLVAEDSERIQQVDESVGRTVQRVEKGVGHLTDAAEYQASTPCVIM